MALAMLPPPMNAKVFMEAQCSEADPAGGWVGGVVGG
jgi:hypothetical protein